MNASMSTVNWHAALALAFFIIACFAAAGLGGLATSSGIQSWYTTITKPSWTPPNAIFGPVWTALYLMMAVAAWLVWRQVGWSRESWALPLFAVQLALNILWSWLFFGLHMLGVAFVEIIVLWVAILLTALAFLKISSAAFWLLIPYLTWVGFATVLNGAIWRLNS